MTRLSAGMIAGRSSHASFPASAGVTEAGRARAIVMTLVCALLCTTAARAYVPELVRGGGTIRGRVVLTGDAHIEMMPITKDPSHCGGTRPSPRLVVGKNHGVKNAVVRIENISQGKPFDHVVHPTLEQRHCEYVPHVMAVPVGTQIEILNSDAILHNVHAYCGPDMHSVFNIAQPIKGQRTCVKQTQLNEPGIVATSCDAGHPWMSAFVLVAANPYYAITDANGNFEIRDVPPGTYRVSMWHEGVKITNKAMEQGAVKRYDYEMPYTIVKDVTVAAGQDAKVEFGMALR